ncbi:MAG: hypothetical protein LBE89_06980 [Helicobacteraceae bacterium]|jgi:hypothetical protein|nr:hypothetical protein [Helicobacteraceae bacterium]
MEIKAYLRMEERYEGLQLVYGTDEEAKNAILKAIDEVKEQTGLNPTIVENCSLDRPEHCAFYMEFDDDFDREGGEFFEKVLCKLGIKKCE